MSRFYNIVIGSETSVQPGGQPASNNAGATFTNQVNGQADLNGQQIEFDLPVTALAGYTGVSSGGKLTIRGVSIQQISQSMNFNGAPISISAGMQNGLPLATSQASQAGVLLQGTIKSAYGNWVGVEQSLEFIIIPPTWPTQAAPANITFSWPKGTNMAAMITNTLNAAFTPKGSPAGTKPTYTIKMNISPNLVLTQDEPGYYQTLEQFSQLINQISLDILGPSNPNYQGVQISVQPGMVLNVFDNVAQTASNTTPTQLNAQDFIGQPTWLGPFTIQFNMVMRADLVIGTYFKFPQALNLQTITTPQSDSFARQNTSFQGTWQILFIRHLGNSRGPNATDWVSTFQAVSTQATADQLSSGNVSS